MFLRLNPHEKDCDAQVDDMSYVKVIPSNLDTLLYINQSCLEDGSCQVLRSEEFWGVLIGRMPPCPPHQITGIVLLCQNTGHPEPVSPN